MTNDLSNLDQRLKLLNKQAIDNLIDILHGVYTTKNLLILDQRLSTLINYLTPFLKLKEIAKIDKTAWIGDNIEQDVLHSFDGFIFILNETNDNLQALSKAVKQIGKKKIHIIVKQLTKSFIYEINKTLNGNITFEKICDLKTGKEIIKFTSMIRLYNWEMNPILIDEEARVLSIESPYGGLDSYFNQPLLQLYGLSSSFISLLENSFKASNMSCMKLKNIYGKGDHANLLINIINNERIPEYLSLKLSSLEQEFYLTKAKGNTDLVVVERNLDFVSVILNQLNYQGLIDDLFGIDIDNVNVGETKYKLNDELYDELKHLNFASIGIKLNELAKFIQNEFSAKDNLQSLNEMKKLVSNLGNLTSKQDLIKKHTFLSECILNYIKNGDIENKPTKSNRKFNEYEKFLNFENELFDIDYKTQISYLRGFLAENFNYKIVVSTIVLISIVNDGIKEKDFDILYTEILDNFGMEIIFVIDNLVDNKIVKINDNNDLLSSALTYLTNQDKDDEKDENKENAKLGISGGINTYKSNYTLINKFWNLHPTVEESTGTKSGLLIDEYPNPSFTLPSSTVPLISRIIESLYLRDFLEYKPVNNTSKRPNWEKLGLDTMFHGKTTDINIDDTLDDRNNDSNADQGEEFVVVICIGGITRGEISCLRYLEQRLQKIGIAKRFIILTSGIVNSDKLLDVFKS
ncbi:uncharacterized protein AC631_03092 [Debaryomyces fabryi]|uniref:Vacuolar protein sorting-associated protein 33 n=1 Tax=Debaryomyces fabryi TaxID=58627 RepID=A0A0V1PYY2_9ASCO|nr:uncharacterized protein AC631_03092 [Debaryomyces fabryi]KSA01151.1 hypothetical protein AC631_03092 [Debaryomyces fabryi]CUM46381.1 unnamed protein product [Debaryomyces fabryi]